MSLKWMSGAAAVVLTLGGGWAYSRAGAPGSSELFLTASSGQVRVGEPVELKLELYTTGRVTVRRDLPGNFGVTIGTAEIGAASGPLGSGLRLSVNPGQARVAADEKVSVTIKGVFRMGKRGVVAFVPDGGSPVGLGPLGTYDVRASFTPYTDDPRAMYRGEAFAKPLRLTVVRK